jgi:hypothetical protein
MESQPEEGTSMGVVRLAWYLNSLSGLLAGERVVRLLKSWRLIVVFTSEQSATNPSTSHKEICDEDIAESVRGFRPAGSRRVVRIRQHSS